MITKENEKEYADKYRKTAKKLGIILSVLITIFGLIIVSVGLFLAIYSRTTVMIVIGSIMAVFGLIDAILGIRFKGFTDRRISKITDKEACYRYCKIHGFKG